MTQFHRYPCGGGGGGGSIPEYTTDPVAPNPGDTWVLRVLNLEVGSPIGMLLSLTYAATTYFYYLSYRTTEGTTVRTLLS